MEPITTAIAVSLGLGLSQVGKKLVEKGVIEPALKPTIDLLTRRVQRGQKGKQADATILKAIQAALTAIGAPQEEDKLTAYMFNRGFDQLQAEGSDELRREFATAVLLLTHPGPKLIPHSLVDALRWPNDRQQLLADFLYATRLELAADENWGQLITIADREETRTHLRQMTAVVATISSYLERLLVYYELAPNVDEVAALQAYIGHVARTAKTISFLFVKPAGRRDQAQTEAELETVFVPLQAQEPGDETDPRRKRSTSGLPEEEEAARQQTLTINDVLQKYPVFLLKGEPGCGKTTLLRHLALTFARGRAAVDLNWSEEPLLPILVPLRNFGRFLRDHEKEYTNPAPLPLRHFIEDYFREYELELPPNFFRDRLKQGRCLLLLDGLDEVADKPLRIQVARIVESFIKQYAGPGNRFGLTSRPKGYEEVAHYLPDPVVCTVQPLAPDVRDRLVLNLLRQFVSDEKQCQTEARDLLDDIRNKRRVDELSRNPLFCTTLVLVYKYGGAALPERRVDVYEALVELMLGFWDTGKSYATDAHELAQMDGTGRTFMDDKDAVEAKRRALVYLADWMQTQQADKDTVSKEAAMSEFADFFERQEGARPEEKESWARGFLDVAHQRSGLFVEAEPETYAFSHKHFREYLAARALVERLDEQIAATVLAHAADSLWEEVIVLAIAMESLSPPRREFLLQRMMDEGFTVLAGKGAVDAGARLPAPARQRVKETLYAQMVEKTRPPAERYEAGQTLDALGWLPPDLNAWVRCPARADDRRDLLVMKYPVTNAHFEQFMLAGGYENSAYWGGDKSKVWQWRMEKHGDYRGKEPVMEPEYWRHARFGRERRGYPVVGVSWYEAMAYAAWLSDILRRARAADPDLSETQRALVADLLAAGGQEIRLPTETEWTQVTGGEANGRYPWDKPGQLPTQAKTDVLTRTNIGDSNLQGASPVGMYPDGASAPFGLMDMAGNVREWTLTESSGGRAWRGGSWESFIMGNARLASRIDNLPYDSYNDIGFRVVSPVISGS